MAMNKGKQRAVLTIDDSSSEKDDGVTTRIPQNSASLKPVARSGDKGRVGAGLQASSGYVSEMLIHCTARLLLLALRLTASTFPFGLKASRYCDRGQRG